MVVLAVCPTPCAAADPAADYLAQLQAESDARQLHLSRMWKLLGHYRPSALSGVTSDVDGPGFFLAPTGKTDPRAELHASLGALFSGTPDDSAQCRFRARYEWLRDTLDIDTNRLPAAECPAFDSWRERLGARSITLVFASAFLNNPASMFGHTFLRLDRDRRGEGADLLAYVVNFAADPTTHNELLYLYRGTTGGFAGRFNTVPYYLKVKEYNDLDSRDLWEYELDLAPAEIHRALAHLWELGPHAMDYYYFDQNCSYQLLGVLEVARPSLRLTDAFPDVVIPAETVRQVVRTQGLVRARAWRPSNRRVMLGMRDALTQREASVAQALGEGEDALGALGDLPVLRQALTLDAAIALHRYRADPDDRQWGHGLLVRRGRLAVTTRAPTVPEPNAPEDGHGAHTLGVSAGADSQGGLVHVTFVPALHDLVAPQEGYARNTELSFLRTAVSVGETGARLEAFDALRIQSLPPLDPWDPAPSWRFHLGAARAHEDGCAGAHCIYGRLGGGPGAAVGLGDQVLYMFVEAEVGYGAVWEDNLQAGLAASGGLLLQLGPAIRAQFEAGITYDLDGAGLPASPVPGHLNGPRGRVDGTLGLRLQPDVELRVMGMQRRGYLAGLVGFVLHR